VRHFLLKNQNKAPSASTVMEFGLEQLEARLADDNPINEH
jgi:hypothetical protein